MEKNKNYILKKLYKLRGNNSFFYKLLNIETYVTYVINFLFKFFISKFEQEVCSSLFKKKNQSKFRTEKLRFNF